ncbi:MAG: hypothetical protein ACRDVE_04505 [Actinocrinis sp.]
MSDVVIENRGIERIGIDVMRAESKSAEQNTEQKSADSRDREQGARGSAKAGWVRVRLTAPQDANGPRGVSLTEGELVLRADRVAVDEDDLVFLCAEEVVFKLDRRYFRALTWFVDRPTFAEWLRSRRKQYPNSHTRWSGDERGRLAAEVDSGHGWQRISDLHGRTVHAVQREAVRDGLVAAEAFPRPGVG